MRPQAYFKMAAAGLTCVVGGPALVLYVSPDPDELFSKYNPELQRLSLENRDERTKQYAEFVGKLREYSKSDKPIWIVAAEEEKRQKREAAAERRRVMEELERQKKEIMQEQLGKG